MEKLKSPLLIAPKSLNELMATIAKYPDAQLFAGGTYIMSRMGYYPNINQRDIISLSNIPELTRVVHVDRFVELGSMVTIRQLLNSSAFVFSEPLKNAISEIGTSVVRRQITVGGSLCTSGIRFSLPCILASLNAQAEIKTVGKRGSRLLSKNTDRWVPVSKLYDNNGDFIFEGKGFLSRIRIPSEQNSVQIFRTVGNPMYEPSSAIIMGFTFTISQDRLTTPNFCLVLPKGGFFCSMEFNNLLSKVSFPLGVDAMVKLSDDLDKMLCTTCVNVSVVQLERAKRLLINTLYKANSTYLYS